MADKYGKMEKKVQNAVQKEIGLEPGFFSRLLDDQLGRDVLGRLGDADKWTIPKCEEKHGYHWLTLDRLPIHPSRAENYDLLDRWQSVLSAVHTMRCSAALALVRYEGRTRVYLGAYQKGRSGDTVREMLSRAARIHMPGMELGTLQGESDENGCWMTEVDTMLEQLSYSGIVTGLPSNRRKQGDTRENLLQTLDKLAYGVPDRNNCEQNYALLVLAQPTQDAEISKLIETLLQLKGEIHSAVKNNITYSAGRNSDFSVDIGTILAGVITAAGAIAGSSLGPTGMAAGAEIGNMVGNGVLALTGGVGKRIGNHESYSVSVEKQNFTAVYCEELLQKYMTRLQSGRSLGFWNVGVYVAGDNSDTVDAVLGMLRSIYSGPESYLEPIRTFNAGQNAMVHEYLRNFSLMPLPGVWAGRSGWHVFGSLYESFSTPMTTEELSITTNLPRRDVPGLRFVHNAVKLTSNPPLLKEGCRSIELGEVMDLGMTTGMTYRLDIDSLVRHVLNDGLTGYGKSNTTHILLSRIAKYGVPWLVIEPVKTDYVEWAIQYNERYPEDKIAIYMPGYRRFYDQELEQMRMNPFQPCAPEGVPLNMQGHIDALASLLTSSVSMGEVLPLLMKEALQAQANDALGVALDGTVIAESNQVDPKDIQGYPHFSDLLETVEELMKKRNYAAENHQNISAAMETRIRSLLLGWKRDFFDAENSTSGKELFGRKVIINLIGIEADEDKAFFMSLILRALYEYRSASYYYLPEYRNELGKDKLMHFTVVEEAHRILAAPRPMLGDAANPQGAAATMFSNMLREIRKWGEGLMIVDQQPASLIPDALKNTDLKIIHRMPSEDDRRAVGACMGLNQEQIDLIAQLDVGQAIISSTHDDAALWVKIDEVKPDKD